MNWYEYGSTPAPPLDTPATCTASNVRVAVMDPSTEAVNPVLPVPRVRSEAGRPGVSGWTPDATWAVTVAPTSVWISSTSPLPVVAGAASMLKPQDTIFNCRVDGGES